MSLKEKKCIPCQGGVPPLPLQDIQKLKKQLGSEWSLTHNHSRLRISYKFKNFAYAMELAGRIGVMAEEQWHHPELVVGFGHLDVEVWTHKINGLVESDFIFCAKVDALHEEFVSEIENSHKEN